MSASLPFDEEGVSDPDADVVETGSDVLVHPVHGQHVDAEAAAQAHFAKRSADHAASGRDERFDRRCLATVDAVDEFDVPVTLQGEEFPDIGADDEPVVGVEFDIVQLAPEALVAPEDVDDTDIGTLEGGSGEDGLADERRPCGHGDLCQELHRALVAKEPRHRGPVGQKLRSDKAEVEQTGRGKKHRDGGHFEKRERGKPLRPGHPIDQKVGRCADKRAHAPEDCGVGERDQQLGGGEVERGAKLDHHGDQHDNNRRVVHEGRRHEDKTADPGKNQRRACLGPRRREFRHRIERARAHKRAGEDKHGRDRPGCGVREHLKHIFGREDARRHQDRPAGQRHDLGRVGFRREEGKHQDHDADGEKGRNAWIGEKGLDHRCPVARPFQDDRAGRLAQSVRCPGRRRGGPLVLKLRRFRATT